MTDDEIIAVVQAHKEGKTIQQFSYDSWRDCCCPYWDFKNSSYRVKPEPRKPREWWLLQDKSLDPITQPTRYKLLYQRPLGCDSNEVIRVREVIEEPHYCS